MLFNPCNIRTDSKGKELLDHGAAAFPVSCHANDLTYENFYWHWHDELEVIVVVEGTMVLMVGTKKSVLKAGEGYFINAGAPHSGYNAGTGNCRIQSAVFHPRLVAGNIDSVFWQKYLRPILEDVSLQGIFLSPEEAWQKEAEDAFFAAWDAVILEPGGYEFAARENLSRLIYLIVEHRSLTEIMPSEKSLRDSRRIKQMLTFIEEHYPDEISMSDIAASAGISQSECLRCFRSVINTTPIQYLKQYRLFKAAELLEKTDAKIVEIAVRCGFQEMSYFAKIFKEMNGMTPTEFKRQHNDEARKNRKEAENGR